MSAPQDRPPDIPPPEMPPPEIPPPIAAAAGWLSPVFFALGLLSTALGIVGMFVPGLPTTVFLIVALWAFSKSSQRLQTWLWMHPRFGPGLRLWQVHRVIPIKAKIAAVSVMLLSLLVIIVEAQSWEAPVTVAAIMVPVALWIATRRSSIPPL